MSDIDDHHDSTHEEEEAPTVLEDSSQSGNSTKQTPAETPVKGNGSKKAQRTRRIKLEQQQKAAAQKAAAAEAERKKLRQAALEDDNDDDDDTEVEDEGIYDEESSQLMENITNAFSSFVGVFISAGIMLCNVCCRLFSALTSSLSHFIGFLLFKSCLYISSTFLINEVSGSLLSSFSARLHFTIQCHAWSILPIVLGK